MNLHTFRCLPEHPENKRWGEGCGREFTGKPGPNSCPFCGAVYVQRVK